MHSRFANVLRQVHTKRKATIPKALREQVWIRHMGEQFQGKCNVVWCTNKISVFAFQCGHNIPESRGGKTNIHNLLPICMNCNISMGNRYSIDEWNKKFAHPSVPNKTWRRFFSCFRCQGKAKRA